MAQKIALSEHPLLVAVYVPSSTTTVSPGRTTFAARWIVLNGAADVPAAASDPFGET
jgi:hypothetical protein